MRAAAAAVEGLPRPSLGSQQRAVMGLLCPVYCTPASSPCHVGNEQKVNSYSKQNTSNSTAMTETAITTARANNDSISDHSTDFNTNRDNGVHNDKW